jgi:hypothetical protein
MEESVIVRGSRRGIGECARKGLNPDRGITKLLETVNVRRSCRTVRGMPLIGCAIEMRRDRDNSSSKTEAQQAAQCVQELIQVLQARNTVRSASSSMISVQSDIYSTAYLRCFTPPARRCNRVDSNPADMSL